MYSWTAPIPPQDHTKVLPIVTARTTRLRRVDKLRFAAASNKFEQVCQWISEQGLNYLNTRLHKYQNIFKDIADAEGLHNYRAFRKKHAIEALVNAVSEAQELFRIYDGLKNDDHPQLKSRLKKILQGHELFTMDQSRARDFSLELDIVACFAKDGISIDHNHIADLSMIIDGIPVFAECKRLKSKNKAVMRIKEGLVQLSTRYNAHADPASARGLLVLSVAALVNPTLELYKGLDEKNLSRKLELSLREFVEHYKRHWEGAESDPRTIGTIVLFDTPAILNGRITTCHQYDIRHRHNLSTSDSMLAKRISLMLAPPAPQCS